MNCPPKIGDVVCQILRTGLLPIRASMDADRCALEADHLHNLPGLLENFDTDLLSYYWNVERVCFIQRSAPDDVADFEPLWQSLAQHVTPDKGAAIAR